MGPRGGNIGGVGGFKVAGAKGVATLRGGWLEAWNGALSTDAVGIMNTQEMDEDSG